MRSAHGAHGPGSGPQPLRLPRGGSAGPRPPPGARPRPRPRSTRSAPRRPPSLPPRAGALRRTSCVTRTADRARSRETGALLGASAYPLSARLAGASLTPGHGRKRPRPAAPCRGRSLGPRNSGDVYFWLSSARPRPGCVTAGRGCDVTARRPEHRGVHPDPGETRRAQRLLVPASEKAARAAAGVGCGTRGMFIRASESSICPRVHSLNTLIASSSSAEQLLCQALPKDRTRSWCLCGSRHTVCALTH